MNTRFDTRRPDVDMDISSSMEVSPVFVLGIVQIRRLGPNSVGSPKAMAVVVHLQERCRRRPELPLDRPRVPVEELGRRKAIARLERLPPGVYGVHEYGRVF